MDETLNITSSHYLILDMMKQQDPGRPNNIYKLTQDKWEQNEMLCYSELLHLKEWNII